MNKIDLSIPPILLICLIFSLLRGLLFQNIKRKCLDEIILIIMKRLFKMNLHPLTGLICFMDYQILLKCLIILYESKQYH